MTKYKNKQKKPKYFDILNNSRTKTSNFLKVKHYHKCGLDLYTSCEFNCKKEKKNLHLLFLETKRDYAQEKKSKQQSFHGCGGKWKITNKVMVSILMIVMCPRR